MTRTFSRALLATTCLAAVVAAGIGSRVAVAADVPVIADAIGGTVTGPKGPEAGVWVIAETHDMPTRFIKIVVTDDEGRFLMPELPKAKYEVWVRGYGLVDSKHVPGVPGTNMKLTAVIAPDAKAAANYYPANYWFSLIHPPAENEFPGTGPKGNGIAPAMQTQQQWILQMTDQCQQCHQQGTAATRYLADNTIEGWAQRVTMARPDGDQTLGNHAKDYARNMNNMMTQFGRQRGLAMWADWTQRIEKGELPHETPPRPTGIERNVVVSSWDWANNRYMHDVTSTDRHKPTSNANGLIYGVSFLTGAVEALDPKTGKTSEFVLKTAVGKSVEIMPAGSLPDSSFPHNPMLDSNGHLWMTDMGLYGRPQPGSPPFPEKPDYCTNPANKFAKYFPQSGQTHFTAVDYDPKSKKTDFITMCNTIHHLMFNVDGKTLIFSGGETAVTWVDVPAWEKTHDAAKAIGWCPMVLDTNSTTPNKAGGVDDISITPDHTKWTNPAPPAVASEGYEGGGADSKVSIDASKDTRIEGWLYGVDANIKDGSMWFAMTTGFPGKMVRFHAGSNPPETCKTEVYEPPKLADGKSYLAFNQRGVSVDSKGIAWGFHGSGQLSRFDRSKCKVMSGPTATGQQCPEGWSAFDAPGPRIPGTKQGSADFHYLGWVDLYDTLGLGKDTVIAAGSNSDSLLAFNDDTKKFTILRVPYPMGFRTRGLDGRIDDPATGWKGKGVWATYSSGPVWHQEGGQDGSGPQLVKVQIRPSTLAY